MRRYVTAVAVAGSALFAVCVARLIGQNLPVECLVFAGLTFISGRVTLKVPSLDASFTVSEVFAFSSVLLFGPEAGGGHAGTGQSGAGVAPPDSVREGLLQFRQSHVCGVALGHAVLNRQPSTRVPSHGRLTMMLVRNFVAAA